MLITKVSQLTGKLNTMDIPVNELKYREYTENRHRNNMPLIQNYFPELSDSEREFILSGITEQEWNDYVINYD